MVLTPDTQATKRRGAPGPWRDNELNSGH